MSLSEITCGDIVYVTENPDRPAIGHEMWADRPAVVVSADIFCKTSNVISVVYLSTSTNKQPCPTHIEITSANKKVIALCEQIHSVDKSRITEIIGHISKKELNDIRGGILFGLSINTGKNPQGIFKKYEKQFKLMQAIQNNN